MSRFINLGPRGLGTRLNIDNIQRVVVKAPFFSMKRYVLEIRCGSQNVPIEKDRVLTMPDKFYNDEDISLKIGIDNDRELKAWESIFYQYGIPVEERYRTGG